MSVDPAKAEAWKTTVETLQRFYSIVIAIALTSALSKLIGILEGAPTAPDRLQAIALAAAFLSTIVPFYHGMERHLYDTHRVLPELGKGGRPFPLLALGFWVRGFRIPVADPCFYCGDRNLAFDCGLLDELAVLLSRQPKLVGLTATSAPIPEGVFAPF